MINRAVKQAGDTIVEVMISIAIVALAIAIAYAISGKNLNVGITAKERTSAVGLVQGQIERMSEVQQTNPGALVGLKTTPHFCFDVNNVSDSAPHNNIGGPVPLTNTLGPSDNDAGKYDSAHCVYGSQYYIDVNYVPLTGSGPTLSGNSFMFTAKWYRIGGGADQIVTIYYRPW